MSREIKRSKRLTKRSRKVKKIKSQKSIKKKPNPRALMNKNLDRSVRRSKG